MELLAQLVLNGIWSGSIYALLGVSWALIFAATRTFHFAHGATFVIVAYITWLTYETGVGLIIASCAGILAGILFGVIIEGVLYRGLRKAGATPLVIFIAALGSLIFIENLIGMVFGSDAKPLNGFPISFIRIGKTGFTSLDLVMVISAMVFIGGLNWFLMKTRSGKAIRAVISNPEMAEVIGININKVFIRVHVVSAILVGIAAILVGLERGMTPELGTWAILYAFIPVIIGGVGSITGAAVAGYIIGLAESIGIWKIASQWQLGIAFVVLLFVLLIRPNGLFGYSVYKGKI